MTGPETLPLLKRLLRSGVDVRWKHVSVDRKDRGVEHKTHGSLP